jgi:diguanylate cyclase (GGDEF)-like protein/PAS domain S-box-containing protein
MSLSGVQRPGADAVPISVRPLGDGRTELFEISIDLLATMDRRGRFLDVNPAAERILGYSRRELIGRRAVDLLHPEDRKRTLALHDPDAETYPDIVEFENRYLRKDGSYRWLQWNARLKDDIWYAVARDITDRRLLEESAVRDPLTGLPNRTGLTDRLRSAVKRIGRRGGLVAVLFVDLDHFKLINDGRGHDVGDRCLCAAAGRLIETVRSGDIVARFGGDEFVVLLEDVASTEAALEIADRVVESLHTPIAFGAEEAQIAASVGVAIASSARITPRALLRQADIAMYRAKSRGGSCFALFDDIVADQIGQAGSGGLAVQPPRRLAQPAPADTN